MPSPEFPFCFPRGACDTAPFREYCRRRRIPFRPAPGTRPVDEGRRWAAALAALAPAGRGRVERELGRVGELAGRDAVAHLLDAAGGGALPPDDVPAGFGVALWFFLHRPELFHEVFFHHEVCEARAWHAGRAAPGLAPATLEGRAGALARELRAFFRRVAGTGRFCAVDIGRVSETVCFAARVADRVRLVEEFGDRGRPALRRTRPALAVLFTYRPRDGRVRVKSPLRAADRVGELLQCFGRAVLGGPVECGGEAFDLDRLKRPFRPLPDAADMAGVRVKTLHLRYPARGGRRHLKLETLAGDEPGAVERLLRAHLGDGAEDLRVCHAELQVRLRVDGRERNYSVRLWPDRCDVDHTPLGDRLRRCLRVWGLARE